jgi:hypothetical protein
VCNSVQALPNWQRDFPVFDACGVIAQRLSAPAYTASREFLIGHGVTFISHPRVSFQTKSGRKELTLSVGKERKGSRSSLAEAHTKSGDMAMAGQYYKNVLPLVAGNANAKAMLKKIEGASGK